MKKVAVFLSLSLCLALAAPAFAVTNPFMDVPLNHWAYDAIGQLAAKGVLSGYPDGTYKGKQPTTRYEMASALARALALVDMTKASKQDVEMLKKLIVEFKDELDALGVKVDQIDKRVAVLESRLGGWKLSGELRLDIEDWDNDDQDGHTALSRARLEVQRWFGEDESMFFYARLEDDGEGSITYDKFYVDFPVWWDMKMTAGRFDRDFEGEYRFQVPGFTDIANDSWLSDRTITGLALQKSFNMGEVNFYVARPDDLPGWDGDNPFYMWEFFGAAQLQFSERFGFDFGFQALLGDDASEVYYALPGGGDGAFKLNNLWTIYAGLRFNFTQDIALKGIYYYQDSDMEFSDASGWHDYNMDSTGAWKVLLDVKQDLLKFSSLWLEYSHLEQGFYLPYGNVTLTLVDTDQWNTRDGGSGFVANDTNIWRVGALQQWNDQWSTWLYVAGHTLDNGGATSSGGSSDAKLMQWGLGVEYLYKPNVGFVLNYINADWDDDAERNGYQDEHRIQFRTAIAF